LILSKSFDVTLVCRNVGRSFAPWPSGVTIERVGLSGSDDERNKSNPIDKLLEFRNFMAAVRAAVARIRPALIYAYEPHAFCAALSATRRIQTAPIIFHLHELPEIAVLPWRSLQTWLTRRALRQTRSASLVVFPEKNRAKVWMRAAGDGRAPLIVPNCPTLGFTPGGYDVAGLIERRWASRKALYIGGLGEPSGSGEAVQSLAYLPADVRVEMVGNGSAEYRRTLLRVAAESGAQARLSIGEFIEHDRLTVLANDAALGLALYKPSTLNSEFSASATNKLFEYAAMGLPVIAPDQPNYREFFADQTWITYANPADPRSIARAIEFVFADRERYGRMSAAARRAFEQKFNYERVFQPVLERALELANRSTHGVTASTTT
jgi:glycosyltransferase involved in cell wall biosynthesis